MVDLIIASVSFTLLVAIGAAVLVAVTVIPMYVAVNMAEARRFSTTRWFLVSSATVGLGLLAAYLLRSTDAPKLLVLLPVALTWAAPAVLWLLESHQTQIGGRAGQHE